MQTPRYLTKTELKAIFTALEERNTKYYDLQVELVDHIATAIERQWERTPTLDFEIALRLQLKYFTQARIEQMQKEKENMLHSEVIKIIHRRTLRTLQKWPGILTILFIFLLLQLFFPLLPDQRQWYLLRTIPGVVFIPYLIFAVIAFFKCRINFGKRFIRLKTSQYGVFFAFLVFEPLTRFSIQGLEKWYSASPDLLVYFLWSALLGYIVCFLMNNYRYFQREYQKAEQILAIHQLTIAQ